jgi:GTP-binding protein HflX
VASFRATLEEAVHADLLLHVLDVGHPHAQQQFDSVHAVLEEIGASENPELLLLNKIDTPQGESRWHEWRTLYPQAIPISGKSGAGLADLLAAVLSQVRGQQLEVTLEADSTDGRLMSFIESHSHVRQREYVDGRVQLRAVMGRRALTDIARNQQVEVKSVEQASEI